MSSLSESCWPLWRKWRIEGCSPTCGQRSSRTCLEVHDEKLTVWCEMYCVNTRFSLTLSPSVMLFIYHPEIYQQPWWKSFICWNVMLKHFCHLVTTHTQRNFLRLCFICVGVHQWDMNSAASVFIFTGLNVMDITCNMVERDVIAVPESWKSRASGEICDPRPPETQSWSKVRPHCTEGWWAVGGGGGCCRIALETLNNCFSTSAETLMNKQRRYNWEH